MRIELHLPGRVLAASLISAALAIGLTACGSSSSTSGATAASGGSNTSSSNTRYQARLNLAKCMRANGVNIPDPSPNGGPAGGGGAILRTAQSSPNFQAAVKACAQYQRQVSPLANLSPAQRAQFQQALVKFAQCMRAHNVNVPDPTASAGGGFGIFRQIPSTERNSPAFQSAFQACSTSLPFRPGGRPGGGAPGA
jgi:hypothetical protein